MREETIFLIFSWNNILHHSHQADEIVTEIEEWKQKVIKCVGGNSCILKQSLLHATDMITVLKLAPIVASSSQE